jgi:hypothetical protein
VGWSVELALKRRKQDVARKSKAETGKPADGKGSEPALGAAGPDTKAAGTTPKSARKKPATTKKPARAKKPAAPKKARPSTAAHEPSDEEIRIRAYFIAERRMRLSLQGDSAHDWIEARRQLIEESRRAATS